MQDNRETLEPAEELARLVHQVYKVLRAVRDCEGNLDLSELLEQLEILDYPETLGFLVAMVN